MKTPKQKVNYKKLTPSELTFNKIAHMGHNVSHAKNRTSRGFGRNLHRATVVLDGITHKVKVPTGVLRKLKSLGLTTHKKLEAAG